MAQTSTSIQAAGPITQPQTTVEDEDTSDPEGDSFLTDFKARLTQNDTDSSESSRKQSKQRLKRLRPNISDGWLVSIKDRLMRQYGIALSPSDNAAVHPHQASVKGEIAKQSARHPRARKQ